MQAITPVTANPGTTPPTDASLAGKTVPVSNCNAVAMAAHATAGAGLLTLLYWDAGLSLWYPWGADAISGSADIDHAKLDGWAHGRWDVGKYTSGVFALYSDGGATLDKSYLEGREL